MKVYSYEGMELELGDRVCLKHPVPKDERFLNSGVGKMFADGLIDDCRLESKQKPWLEIYFDVTLYKKGVPITDEEMYRYNYLKDTGVVLEGESAPEDEVPHTTQGDYLFLRYVLKKGATKMPLISP